MKVYCFLFGSVLVHFVGCGSCEWIVKNLHGQESETFGGYFFGDEIPGEEL